MGAAGVVVGGDDPVGAGVVNPPFAEAASVLAVAGGRGPGSATPATGGADTAIGVGGVTDFGVTMGGATPVTGCVPAGTGAPSGTRAVGVPIVSGAFVSAVAGVPVVAAAGGRGLGSTTPATEVLSAIGAAIVSAVIVDPTTDLARAVGVLRWAAVEAIGVDPAVTALAALGAGAPASVFWGGAGLNESRIFCAAA